MAQVEIRLRVVDGSGAWRMLVSSPSGAPPGSWSWVAVEATLLVSCPS